MDKTRFAWTCTGVQTFFNERRLSLAPRMSMSPQRSLTQALRPYRFYTPPPLKKFKVHRGESLLAALKGVAASIPNQNIWIFALVTLASSVRWRGQSAPQSPPAKPAAPLPSAAHLCAFIVRHHLRTRAYPCKDLAVTT